MSVWTDITSYSQGDRDRTPGTFEINLAGVRLVVTRRLHEEGWHANCPPFFTYFRIGSEDIESAKNEALTLLNVLLLRAQESVLVALEARG